MLDYSVRYEKGPERVGAYFAPGVRGAQRMKTIPRSSHVASGPNRDFASRSKCMREEEDLLHKVGRTDAEERRVQKILRARGWARNWIPRRQRRRASVSTMRSLLIRRVVRRSRARRIAPATAARAADSGGSGDLDPDPEPPRPRLQNGGAL